MRVAVCVVVVALAVGLMAAPAWAQGGAKKGANAREKGGTAHKETGSKKDPVADAFALPHNVHLRSDQQEPYNKLKQQMEPKLRDALSKVEAATGADKDKAAKSVLAIRKEIRGNLTQILQKADPEAIKRQQEAVKAAQKARQQQQEKQRQQQQRQKQLQQQKKRG